MLATFALLLFLVPVIPLSAWAQSVSTVTTSENIASESTIYVGEVVVDGTTMVKYLYSGNISIKEVVIQDLLDGLKGMNDGDYANLLEGFEFDYSTDSKGLALCSDSELAAAMDANWSSAQYVGTQYFPDNSVASETNSNLYDVDTGFKAKLDAQTEARAEDIENLANVEKCIVSHVDSRTVTDVWYNIVDGQVVRHSDINVIYDSEAITVIYTKAELESSPNTTQEAVDLGLPSGTLWATCNVGANEPQDIGLFFAWGDTEGHGNDPADGYFFNWENYKWCEVVGYDSYFTKYCSDSSRGKDEFIDGKSELDPEDDAAYVNWGSQWRTPSNEQLEELRNECTWTPTTLQGVDGYEVKGPNDNSIFLPTTGWRIDDMLLEGGAYWSRSSDPEDVGGAYYLSWDDWGWYSYGGRVNGQCIRPVVNDSKTESVTLNSDDEGNYWATFYSDASYTADENTIVYTAKVNSDKTKAILTKVADNTIPAGNAVLLKSTNKTAVLTYADGVSGTLEDNELQGTSTPITTPANTYMLVKGNNGVGFYHWTGETIPAGRGYLTLSSAAGAPSFLSFGIGSDDNTGIEALELTTEDDGIIYDLAGRRLTTAPRQSIYVKNGKKYIVK
ncbi:MAG: hypothetical protein IKN83_01490 [Bacteroidaceae bacterium]|nr:hypothetical protein [Bacteroidaceae bacterium]